MFFYLKRLVFGMSFLILFPIVGFAQMVVEVPTLTKIQSTALGRTLQQIEQMHERIQLAKNQLQYAKRRTERQLEAMKGLKDANWSNIEDINNNIRRFDMAQVNLTTIDDYLNRNYQYLYDDFNRMEMIKNNPAKADEIEEDRYEHLEEQVKKIIGTAGATDEGVRKFNDFLNEVRREMEKGNITPQQQRQINGQIQSTIAQQMNQLTRVVARYSSFAASQAEMERDQKQEDELRREQELSEYKENKMKAMNKWLQRQDSVENHFFGNFDGELEIPEKSINN